MKEAVKVYDSVVIAEISHVFIRIRILKYSAHGVTTYNRIYRQVSESERLR